MPPVWQVDHYHLNIGLGDSAIHVLALNDGGRKPICYKVVWIDMGWGTETSTAGLVATFADIARKYRGTDLNDLGKLVFDAVIVTHWDHDHYGGLPKFLQLPGDVSLHFHSSDTSTIPATTFYCPDTERKKIKQETSHCKMGEFVEGDLEGDMFIKKGERRLAKVVYGKSLLGCNVFVDHSGVDDPTTVTSLDVLWHRKQPPPNCTLVSGVQQPAMYCIAVDEWRLGALTNSSPATWDTLWADQSTDTNRSSIATIVVWPRATNRISHYSGGDLNSINEDPLLAWLKASPQAYPITTMKLSHHGACSSTPPSFVNDLKPIRIVISAATKHHHPDWETLIMLYAYALKDDTKFQKFGPISLTCYPYWWMTNTDKWKKTVLNKYYFDTSAGQDLTSERKKLIDGFRQKMLAEENPTYRELLDTLAAQPDMSEVDIYQKLQTKLRCLEDTLILNFTKLKELAAQGKGLQYIYIKSCIDVTEDGLIYFKQWNGAETSPESLKALNTDLGWTDVKIFIPNLGKRVGEFGDDWDAYFYDNAKKHETEPELLQPLQRLSKERVVERASRLAASLPARKEIRNTGGQKKQLKTRDTVASPPAADFEYSLWGSAVNDAQAQGSKKGRRLLTSESLNSFVCRLRSGAIRLPQTPSMDGVLLDTRDSIRQWMQWSIKASEVSLRGSDSHVDSLSIKGPQSLVFDTVAAQSSLNLDNKAYKIENDGLLKGFGNLVMVFGLSLSSTTDWKLSGICDLLDVMSNKDSVSPKTNKTSLHSIVGTFDSSVWKLNTDNKALAGSRNAIWFSPQMNYLTNVRLSFDLDPASIPAATKLLQNFWPGVVTLAVHDVQLICKYKTYLSKETKTNISLVSQSQLILCSKVKATIPSAANPVTVVIVGVVDLTSTGDISLTVQSNDPNNDFTVFITALIRNISGDPQTDPTSGSVIPDSIKDTKNGLRFRQVTLTVGKNGLQHAGLTLEVATTIGKTTDGDAQNVAIRLDASYTKGAAGGGLALAGGLWFPPKDDPNYPARYFSGWETFKGLIPITPKAAESLSLAQLFSEANIDLGGLPNTIPRFITRADFFLTMESLSISGVIERCSGYDPYPGELPSLSFEEVSIDITRKWKPLSTTVGLEFRIALKGPGGDTVTQPTCTNELVGSFHYQSGTQGAQWEIAASIQELRLGMLYEYFSEDTKDLLYDVLKDIKIQDMIISYGKADQANAFLAKGALVISDAVTICLTFTRKSTGDWQFDATVSTKDPVSSSVTLGDLARSLFGSQSSLATGMPDFVSHAEILGPNAGGASFSFLVKKGRAGGVEMVVQAEFGHIQVTMVQLHGIKANDAGAAGEPKKPDAEPKGPIRYFRLGLKNISLPQNIPVLAGLEAPFDEVALFWVNSVPSAEEAAALTLILQSRNEQKSEGEMVAGFHFVISAKGKTIIDFPLSKGKAPTKKTEAEDPGKATEGTVAKLPEKEVPDDSQSPKTPFKKSQGPLTINDIRLHYKDNVLAVQMDAIFVIGPLTFALLGFEIGYDIKGGLSAKEFQIKNVHVDIEGLAASFNKPPLTIEGGLIHRKDATSDVYAGGITIGFVPWLFQAAGFYGRTKKSKTSSEEFTSALVYAMLSGPLVTLEFATISNITGGFGYNVGITIPSVADVYKFPFLNPGPATDIVTTLQGMIEEKPDTPRWFYPEEGAMWVAAGLTVTAFEMLAVTAVLVAQWSPQLQFHVLGLATADIPSSKSPVIFAHVELGFLASIDVVGGRFGVDAQLSPNSYILHKDCHLSGGFALYYWFKTSESGTAGDFVLSIGGYHSAYEIPATYPRPPRLAISWSFNDSIAIRGEAYFAITPKCCMAGLHINASLSLGPLRAWFDAYADFLVNYAPFNFQAVGHVSVGVSYSMTIWFVHLHIEIEIGATLYLSGPPVVGTVHVDFWVFGFDINFGGNRVEEGKDGIPVKDFYDLVLQDGAKTGAGEKAPHVYSCLGGLIASEKESSDATWNVRGGPFAFAINAPFAAVEATVNGRLVEQPPEKPEKPADMQPGKVYRDKVYAKPMHADSAIKSTLSVTVNGPDKKPVPDLRPSSIMKSVPSALWGQYSPDLDPAGGKNSISELLTHDNGTSLLMMGVEIHAPIPTYTKNDFKPFDVGFAFVKDVFYPPNPRPLFPKHADQSTLWTPADPIPLPTDPVDTKTGTGKKGAADPPPPPTQWDVVKGVWEKADARTTVAAWAKIMGWAVLNAVAVAGADTPPVLVPAVTKGTADEDSTKQLHPLPPHYLVDHIADLYLEAPCLCV